MSDHYDAYCAVDPLFFDALNTEPEHDFAVARRPVPDGWRREVLDDWLSYSPVDLTLPNQGWKVHVSACLDNAVRVLETVWDYCLEHRLAFKFLRGPRVLLMRNAKYAGRGSSGKFITVYPRDDVETEAVCRGLDALLAGEPGPYILSDVRWAAGPVYVRYGGFASRFCIDAGQVVPAIENPDGVLVPDHREPVFSVPPWVSVPDFLAPHVAARNATSTTELPYEIEDVLHFSNAGGLYRAKDRRDGTTVVLKEARPYAGLDGTGADAVKRLERERQMLERLAGLPQVPRVHDSFPLGEHRFLALEYLDGTPLNQLVVRRYPLIDNSATEADFADYTSWALDVYRRVERAVAAIHDRGVVYGDLHLFNVLVRPDGDVALVDFEVAAPVGEPNPPALRNQGFAAPRHLTGPDVDHYALACLRLALFAPLTALLRLSPGKAAHLADIAGEHFPLPAGFLAEAVERIAAGATPVRPRLTPGPSGWRTAREQLATAILASATPGRDDRLFPGDIAQFRPGGGLGLGYGAAGVLYALSLTGAGRFPEYEEWLTRRVKEPAAGTRCGFYDGLHGVAYVLEHLGRRAEALDVIDLCLREPWQRLGIDLAGGLAGIGLNLAHFAELTGDPELRAAADRAVELTAERLAEPDDAPPISGGGNPYAGLTHGCTGAALLFLREYERRGDKALLDLAATALRRDLRRCVVRPDGAMEVNEGWRTMPYLGRGSAGIGLVLDQYLAHRDDEQFAEASEAIHLAARAPFFIQSGLFAGRAGILLYLLHRGEPAAVEAQVRRLAWHALPYADGLAFPGEQLLRLSMDLATGSAGVLLALGAALHDRPVDLPFLTPSRPPSRREGAIPYPRREEVLGHGSSGPSGHEAGL